MTVKELESRIRSIVDKIVAQNGKSIRVLFILSSMNTETVQPIMDLIHEMEQGIDLTVLHPNRKNMADIQGFIHGTQCENVKFETLEHLENEAEIGKYLEPYEIVFGIFESFGAAGRIAEAMPFGPSERALSTALLLSKKTYLMVDSLIPSVLCETPNPLYIAQIVKQLKSFAFIGGCLCVQSQVADIVEGFREARSIHKITIDKTYIDVADIQNGKANFLIPKEAEISKEALKYAASHRISLYRKLV